MKRLGWLLVAALVAAGCEKKAEPTGVVLGVTPGPRSQAQLQNDLREVGIIHLLYLDMNAKKPATALADITPFAKDYPQGLEGLRNGTYVMVWNRSMPADRLKVLAYEKDAPQRGGWVVFVDGTVKKVSKEEFEKVK